jgi:hypothetical protein
MIIPVTESEKDIVLLHGYYKKKGVVGWMDG